MPDIKVRHELKFYMPEAEYAVLRQRLMNVMPFDAFHPEDGNYHIRSLYFDDINNTAMWEKMDGVEYRSKYRIRIYNLKDDVISLEKKIKLDSSTAKHSARLTRRQCDAILAGDISWMAGSPNALVRELYAAMRSQLLRPVVIVDYMREAYMYPPGNVRITFDRELHSGQFSHDLFSGHVSPVPILPPGQLILEVKYDDFLAPHIRNILQTTKGLRSAISKYALCRMYH